MPLLVRIESTQHSIKPSRVNVGSNSQMLAALNDDDESTAWSSTSRLAEAWAEFDLEKPATVSEVVLRLGSWRTTSYPIRVLVDGKETFAGVVPSTVGYSTIRLNASPGKGLRIELAGTPRGGGNVEVIEITGKSDTDGGDEKTQRCKLAIHEIELFGELVGG